MTQLCANSRKTLAEYNRVINIADILIVAKTRTFMYDAMIFLFIST